MFKNLVEEGRAAALNGLVSHPAVLKMANTRLARYAELLSLNYGREGFHARARLLGSGEEVRVCVRSVVFSADCSSVKLEGFSASAPWCQHLLEDFVEGRSFAIPEPARLPLRPLAKML